MSYDPEDTQRRNRFYNKLKSKRFWTGEEGERKIENLPGDLLLAKTDIPLSYYLSNHSSVSLKYSLGISQRYKCLLS